MKRLFVILSILCISMITFANASFDKTINYQGKNAQAYVGETLYLLPLTGSWYGKKISDKYHNFKNSIYQDGYGLIGENVGMQYQYKFNPYDSRDNKVSGTHKRHIEGHRFYVNKVVQDPKYSTIWVFYLTDLNTGDNLKYIYHSELDGSLFQTFPFIVEKHFKYCKSLIGSKLVFGTHKKYVSNFSTTYYSTFEKDINTGEPINYTKSYAIWTIKKVEINIYYSCICFIVTDGKQTTKVPYNIQYSECNDPFYNNCTRVFTKTQWNNLVKKYGEHHMESIMANIPLDDMTQEELYMAGGRYAANGLYKDDNKSVGEIAVDAFVKSTRETVKTYKEAFKFAKKTLFN